MALARRRPDRGLIHHSDQGCQPGTRRCCSPNAARKPGSRSRWAQSAIAMTTPSARPFTPASRRSGSTPIVADPSRGADRDLRVHRGLVQPPAPALHARLPVPDRVRATPHRTRPTAAPGPDFGQRIGRVARAEGLRRAYNASLLDGRRRFRRPTLDLSRERHRRSNSSRSGRDGRRSRDERQLMASPTRSQGASSLIQTSTTTAKTCRPNRGRSTSKTRSSLARSRGSGRPGSPHTCRDATASP